VGLFAGCAVRALRVQRVRHDLLVGGGVHRALVSFPGRVGVVSKTAVDVTPSKEYLGLLGESEGLHWRFFEFRWAFDPDLVFSLLVFEELDCVL
jgi:hypothetical protein